MENNVQEFKKLSFKKLFDELSQTIDELYSEYSFVYVTKNKFINFIKPIIKEYYDSYNEEIEMDYLSYFKSVMIEKIRSLLVVVSTRKTFKNVINNYIDTYLIPDESSDPFVQIDKLSKFFMSYDIIISPDFINSIIKNKFIYEYVDKIFNSNKDVIVSGKYIDVYSNELLISLIEAYVDKNHIQIEDTIEYDDYSNTDLTHQYMYDIKNYDLLTEDEEKELGLRILAGDEAAKDEMVLHNLRLVLGIARRHVGRGLDFEDLIQEGNLGLYKAANKFDVRKGYRFSTYATWWIRQNIQRAIDDYGRNIRIPCHVLERLARFNRLVDNFNNEYGREPTSEEVANKTGMQIATINYLFKLRMDTLSLEKKVGDEEETEYGDFIPDKKESVEDSIIRIHLRRDLEDAMREAGLTEREIEVLFYRFGVTTGGVSLRLEEIGKKIGVCRERIRQNEESGLNKLNGNQKFKERMKDYLDIIVTDKKAISSNESRDRVFVKPNTQVYTVDMKLLDNFTLDKNEAKSVSCNTVSSIKKKVVKAKKKVTKKEKTKKEEKEVKVVSSKKKFNRLTNIYTYFDVPKELIDKTISVLNEGEREILYKKFGGNLEEPVLTPLSKDENIKLYQRILPKMKRIIGNNGIARGKGRTLKRTE